MRWWWAMLQCWCCYNLSPSRTVSSLDPLDQNLAFKRSFWILFHATYPFSGFFLQTFHDNSRERAHENCGGCCKSTESSPQFKNISLVFWEFKRALKSTQLGCSSFTWVFSWDPAGHWTAWHCTKSPETDYLPDRLSPRQIISQRQIILWKLSMLGLTSIHPPSGCKLAPIALQWQVINHTWMGDNEDFVSIWPKHPVKYVVLLGKRGILYILGRMQKV